MEEFVIPEEAKIPLIALSKEIQANQITVNKAFKKAQEELRFQGNMSDFIALMEKNGLIPENGKAQNTSNIEKSNAKEDIKAKNKEMLNKALKFTVVVALSYGVYKLISTKK